MDKKKNIILIVSGILCLVVIAIVFILLLKRPSQKEDFIFSEQEIINVSTKTEDISFFNNSDFTKLSFSDENLIKEFKNIVSVSENNVMMKNIFLYDVTGDFEIVYKDNKFHYSEFKVQKLKTSADAFASLKKINEKISTITNSEKKDFQLISNDNTVKLDNEIQLNQKDSHVSVEYKTQGLSYTINMECGNNEYEIIINVK